VFEEHEKKKRRDTVFDEESERTRGVKTPLGVLLSSTSLEKGRNQEIPPGSCRKRDSSKGQARVPEDRVTKTNFVCHKDLLKKRGVREGPGGERGFGDHQGNRVDWRVKRQRRKEGSAEGGDGRGRKMRGVKTGIREVRLSPQTTKGESAEKRKKIF